MRELTERELAISDHMYLATEVMGMDFQEVPHRALFDEFVQKHPEGLLPLYDLSETIKKRMILWPRGTYKTSAIIVEIVQLILAFPNVRICFITGGDVLGKRQLSRVKRVFERPTPKFQKLFPEACSRGKKLGNAHEFTVPSRTNDTFAEPTMSLTSARSVKSGGHFDVIIADDLVNDQNYKKPEALQATIEQYKEVYPLLEPDGYLYVTGTRWSFGDLYEEIQDLAKKEMKELGTQSWQFSIMPCWVRYCANCQDWCHHRDLDHAWKLNATEPVCFHCNCKGWKDSGIKDVLFPKYRTRDGRTQGHTVKGLETMKIQLGPEMFSCLYENNPLATELQTFTPELIGKQTLFHDSQIPTQLQCPTFFVGDLAYTAGQTNDRDNSVIYVARYFQGQIFVVDCMAGKWDSLAVCENLYRGLMKHRPTIIWLEKFLGWEAYNTVFEMYAHQKNLQRLPVEWHPMSYGKAAKLARMGAVKAPMGERRLWLSAAMPFYENLVNDLKKWPKLGRHDDFGDCLGLVCQVPTGFQSVAAPARAETAISWLRKLNPRENENPLYDSRVSGSF